MTSNPPENLIREEWKKTAIGSELHLNRYKPESIADWWIEKLQARDKEIIRMIESISVEDFKKARDLLEKADKERQEKTTRHYQHKKKHFALST